MHRYLVFLWAQDDRDSRRRVDSIQSTVLATPLWQTAYRTDQALVMHCLSRQTSPCRHLLPNLNGVVIGSLFTRTSDSTPSHSVGNFSESETQHIVESGGSHLVKHYWGAYIALFRDSASGTYGLLRDPTANLPCFHLKWNNMDVFFSDMEDLSRYVTVSLSVNWPHIVTRLLAGFTYSRDCGVNEIEDIPGGEYITPRSTTNSRNVLWHPARFCTDEPIESEGEASRQLYATVNDAVRALASGHERILVFLSGGLDSSIITTRLAQCYGPDVTCLNFYITGNDSPASPSSASSTMSRTSLTNLRRITGNADERGFARKVAYSCAFKLLEKEREVFVLNAQRLHNAPLAPRPSGYVFLCDEDDLECEIVAESGVSACFSGQGGDTVFYASLRAIGALDYAFAHPFGLRHLYHIRLTAALSGESIAHVLAKVIRHGFLRAYLPPSIDPFDRPHLLRDDAIPTQPGLYSRHPWLATDARLCPGKSNHVLGVAHSVPLYQDMYRRERFATSVHPLASQPVVETCLRIPTYVLLAGGISRGLARRTFQDCLPPEVVRRISKGSGMAFYQNVARRNMRFIRDQLLDGVLAREGLLDRSKLEAYLTPDQPFLTVQPDQIMDYLACEAWLSQVTSTTSAHAVSPAEPVREDAPRSHIDSACSGSSPRAR
jgi:asparagine synthase (glutamine-hydrolysing)